MLNPNLIYAGTIQDLQNRDDLTLVTDSQEVQAVLESIFYPLQDDEYPMDFSGLFISLHNGEYTDIFAYEGIIPYLYKNIWKICLH